MARDARDIALRALRDRAGNVTAALRRMVAEEDLAAADRGLAREIALGVVRRRGTLQTVLRAFLKQPDRKLPSPLEEVFLIALYQLIFLQRVPAFAAVNEAVRQAAARRPAQRGFVNGVLRSIERALGEVETGGPPREPDVIPIAPELWRRIDRPIFADPKAEPVAFLAAAYSMPDLLAQRWLAQTDGKLSTVIKWATHANTPAPLIARVNVLKATVAEALEALAAENVEANAHANGRSVVFTDYCDVTALRVFQAGWIQPQDPSATEVVAAADLRAGMKVLDFCAAPGTKTTHLAERLANTGEIAAVDVSAEKLARVDDNCRRMGVGIVRTVPAKRLGELAALDFDVVLVDAPCSNTGVLSRRPEARWRFTREALGKWVHDQKALLSAAASYVRPGGQLIYSTCSIEPEECHELAKQAAARLSLTVTGERLTRPTGVADATRWRDGGYYAIFRRA